MTLGLQDAKQFPNMIVEKSPYVGARGDNVVFPLSFFDGQHGKDFERFGLNDRDYNALCFIASLSTGVLASQSKDVQDLREEHKSEEEVYLNQERDIIVESYTVVRFTKSDENIPNDRIIGSIKDLLSKDILMGVRFLSGVKERNPNDILIFISHGERNLLMEKIRKLPGISDVKTIEDGLHIYNFRRRVKKW